MNTCKQCGSDQCSVCFMVKLKVKWAKEDEEKRLSEVFNQMPYTGYQPYGYVSLHDVTVGYRYP